MELKKISQIDLPHPTSWSIRWGDYDGDGIGEFVSSSRIIHIIGYNKSNGLFKKAVLPNAANLVDVVRIADLDNDESCEIIASGNSGCFTIYKAENRGRGNLYYPVVYQSTPPSGRFQYSQGLNIGDIDGDDKNEILLGLTGREKQQENILIYEKMVSSQ